MPQVWNISRPDCPRDAVYIGRGTPWGNPFRVGVDGTRDHVIGRFKCEVLPKLDIEPLRGKDLACHCAPRACHGDAILERLEWAKP